MDSWSVEHLNLMKLGGGNHACQDYLQEEGGFQECFEENEDDDVDLKEFIQAKYSSEAAQAYKELLKERVTEAATAATAEAAPPALPAAQELVIHKTPSMDETQSTQDLTESPATTPCTEKLLSSTTASAVLMLSPSTTSAEGDPLFDASAKSFCDDEDDHGNGGDDQQQQQDDSPEFAEEEEEEEEEDEEIEEDMEPEEEKQEKEDKLETSCRGGPLGALDSWFSKVKQPPAGTAALTNASNHTSSTGNSFLSSAMSSMTGGRRSSRSYRRQVSSASAPTITYMGRSFSADGSDDNKLLTRQEAVSARVKRQSSGKQSIQLLALMAQEQDEIARETVSETPWRQSSMTHYQGFSAEKKVEPFCGAPNEGGGLAFFGNNHNDNHHARSSSAGTHRKRWSSETSATQQQIRHQQLAYTDSDILDIAQDSAEFARLQRGLKSKGAVTNEVLKQKLYAFVANSKLRRLNALQKQAQDDNGNDNDNDAANDHPNNNRRRVKASKSEDLSLLRSHTIHTSTAKRL